VISRELASLHQRWADYQQLPHLTTHWYWRPGWREDRRAYTWHLTFADQPDLHALVAILQRELPAERLDLVPLPGLHLTVQGVGFTDEVTDHDLHAIINATRQRLADLSAFNLAVGPVDADAEGVGLLISPWAPVEGVRHAIRDAIATVWPTVPEPAEGFRPHITIAYSGAPALTGPIRTRLAHLRERPPVTVNIRAASLIELRRDHREYRWETIATAALT
jgi:2'-5' RNA ligase